MKDSILRAFDELREATGGAFDGVCAHRFVMEQRSDGDPCEGCPEKQAGGPDWKCPYASSQTKAHP